MRGLVLKKRTIMDRVSIARSITRISHEIIENSNSSDEIVLIGIHNRGVPLASRIQKEIFGISGLNMKLGSLDITFHRDDYRDRLVVPQVKGTNINEDINHKTLILVDDVLYTGRTIRAAMDELHSFGRPNKIQLAVLVDRGHREVPIRADFVGANIPTHEGEHVKVELEEIDDKNLVSLIKYRVKK